MTAPKSNDIPQNEDQILVLDTNIFLMGIDFNVIKGKLYTVPEILDEIKVERYLEKNRNILNRIDFALNSNKLILKIPEREYLKKVKKVAKITGDLTFLSEIDISLIALTLELDEKSQNDVYLYTNDYSMENVSSELNIKFSPLGKKGIKKKILYEVYCPFCNEGKESDQKICEKCGMKLKRRPRKEDNK